MTSKKCAIITAYYEGTSDGAKAVFENFCGDEGYVICADGGLLIAKKAGIKPDLIVGDFDSLSCKEAEKCIDVGEAEIARFSERKDFTDTGLALEEAAKRGFTEVKIIGGMGGRPDHTIANIQNISGYSGRFAYLDMEDDVCHMNVLTGPGKRVFMKDDGEQISIFSLSDVCVGVTEEGVDYPLKDHKMTSDYPLGVSNRILSARATISLMRGSLLIVQLKQR